MADEAYNKTWNKGFVAGVGAAKAGTDAGTTDDEAWNEGFRSGVRAERRTRQYRAQQAQPAEPVTVTAMFDEAALKALDLQVEKAVEKTMTEMTAHFEFDAEYWQRLAALISPAHDETWETLARFPVGTRFIRTEDGLAAEDEEADE